MTDRYEPTGQRLHPYRASGERLARTPKQAQRRESTPPAPQRTNGELVRAWTDCIASVDGFRFLPKTESNKQARATAEDALRDAGDALIARVRQSYADAAQ
jgi:hypothetical protein